MAVEFTTEGDTGASGSPLTGKSAVIRQAPVWPPLKVVNMPAFKLGTGTRRKRGSVSLSLRVQIL
jgi:hypothetical protein